MYIETIENNLCSLFRSGECNGCVKGSSYLKAKRLISGSQEHECEAASNGYCKEFDIMLVCKKCKHKGFLIYLYCMNVECMGNTLMCPNCKRLILVDIETRKQTEV